MDDGSSKPTAQSPAGPGSVELPRGGLRNQAEALASGPTNGLRSQLLSLLLWLMVALLLRWLVVEPRWIPSGSMLPTLQLQDRILVEKVRPHLGRNFKPGTVVVFHPPPQLQAAGYAAETALIKRLVGLPGDQIAVRDGQLWRNGQVVQPDWKAEPMDYDLPELTVPPGELLVLGDNRNASLDSHLWGTLPEGELIGTAVLRYWPLNRFGPIRFSPTQEATGAAE